MRKLCFFGLLLLSSLAGFAKVKPDAPMSKDGSALQFRDDTGPVVLDVYYYYNDNGKKFEFHVVSNEDYETYCRAYARNWSWAADDCVAIQGDCMDDVVITPID